jgi:uncharacterized pyridoxamine 5'-phosphate oxidase family protein
VTVRVRGKAEFRNDMAAKQKIIDTNPLVQSIYQTADNPSFEVFFLDHGEAVISDFSGRPPRAVTF